MPNLQSILANRRLRFLVFMLVSATVAVASDPSDQIIYSFPSKPDDGIFPGATPIVDKAGNLYLTTLAGGKLDRGTVVELSPPTTDGGTWTETVIYRFNGTQISGASPIGTLTMDALGNLYGTTQGNWHAFGSVPTGSGTVFRLTHPSKPGGLWHSTLLRNLNGIGFTPKGRLALDSAGNLYGTAIAGGTGSVFGVCAPGESAGCGIVFEVSPPLPAHQNWRIHVIHSFGSFAGDGVIPANDLVLRDGALYGTTTQGGINGFGRVFQLVQGNGKWTENTLHDFSFDEGEAPMGTLIFDGSGNIYGTTYVGLNPACPLGCGSVFKLSPPMAADQPWQETTLYKFAGGADGANPQGGLVRDEAGNLYGTTTAGALGFGVVYKLTPPASPGEAWTESTLHEFAGSPSDGSSPTSSLILANGDSLIGSTTYGGASQAGIVFAVKSH
jgi:hypothetical protein